MSQAPRAPTEFYTEYGHSTPVCTQFSVFLENRVGRLYDLMEVFEEQTVKLVAFSILEASDHAVVRVVTTKSDVARRALQGEKLPYSESEILSVQLNHDQRMSQICRALLAAELNISYAYPMLIRTRGGMTVAVHCDDLLLAGEILQKKGFHLLGEDELSKAAGDVD